MFESIVRFIREQYGEGPVALHPPVFLGNEKAYLNECIDSTFVSSVGPFVTAFENSVAEYVGSRHAVAVVNGTQALFIALRLAGAAPETEVLTQSLTFIATANAISYTGSHPVFIDVDEETLGLSPRALETFLAEHAVVRNGRTINRTSGRPLAACVPMHTCGIPCRIVEIRGICDRFGIPLVEDAAESLGSFQGGRHTGTFGLFGVFSFNGNKIVTTGGGGMIVTDNDHLARRAKHLTTTAKLPHRWEFVHDEIGFNFRLPNLNAALGVAQMESLPAMLAHKRKLAEKYRQFFENLPMQFVGTPDGSESNCWLNTVLFRDREERDSFLAYGNDREIMMRSLWRPMHLLPMYAACQTGPLPATEELYARAANLPSGLRP